MADAKAAPLRIQLRRFKGWRMPPNTVKVDRSTKWGNPFRSTSQSSQNADAVQRFRAHIDRRGGFMPSGERFVGSPMITVTDIRSELAGKCLGCWCALCDRHRNGKPIGLQCDDCEPCHSDVLGIIAAS